MNKINKLQFISLMLICDVFVLFCLTGSVSVVTALGFAAGSLLQLIISIPLLRIYRKGKTLTDCGKTAEAIVLICLALWGGLLFSMMWSTGDVIYIPYENSGMWGHFLIAGLIAAVCVYISSSGIKALARSAVIAAAMGAVCLLIVIICALIRSDYTNLTEKGESGFFRELIKGFAISGGLTGFTVILGFTKGNVSKTAMGYFIGKITVTAAVIITGVLVSGGIMKITDFPIAASAQLSQPFPVQRIDSLFLIVFSVFAVYAIGVQAVSADYLLGELFPKLKKYRSSISLAVMAAVGFLFGGTTHYGLIFGILSVSALIAVPTAYFFKKKVRV